MSTTTPQMGLTVPQQNDPSPGYISAIANSFGVLDAHNHASGSGVQVPTAGLNINADLPFSGYSARYLRSTAFASQSSQLNTAADGTSLYVYNGDLWYVTAAGVNVQLTSGAALAPPNLSALSSLTITNLTATNATLATITNQTITSSVASKAAAFNLNAVKTITTYASPRDFSSITGSPILKGTATAPALILPAGASALVYIRLPRVGTMLANTPGFVWQLSATAAAAPTAVLYPYTYSTSGGVTRGAGFSPATALLQTQTAVLSSTFSSTDSPYDRTMEWAILFTNNDTGSVNMSVYVTYANTSIRTTDSMDAFA